jgi:hypothetical protein
MTRTSFLTRKMMEGGIHGRARILKAAAPTTK